MKKSIKILNYVQLALSILTMLLLLTLRLDKNENAYLPSGILWLSFLSMIVFLTCLILEFIVKNKPIVRTCLLSIGLVLTGICFSDSINLAAIFIALFCIPYAIVLIVVVIKKPGLTETISSSTNTKIIMNKTLPEGVLDKKILIANYIYFASLVLIVFITVITLNHFNIKMTWSLLLIPIATIALIILNQLLNPLRKTLKLINKDLNYAEFQKSIDALLVKNIHPETYNYLTIIKANYMLVENKELAINIFKSTHQPKKNKQQIEFYKVIEVEILFREKKYNEALEKIKYLNPIHQANMTNLYNIVATETEILNIESICSNKAKLKFTEISNVKLKMYYYYTRNNIEKAKENAKKILDFSCDFKVYNEEAKRIISL